MGRKRRLLSGGRLRLVRKALRLWTEQRLHTPHRAGQANLDQEAQQAHGEYLKRQAEYRRRSVQTRIEKAKQLVEERRAQAKAQVQAGANGATAATAGAGRKSA